MSRPKKTGSSSKKADEGTAFNKFRSEIKKRFDRINDLYAAVDKEKEERQQLQKYNLYKEEKERLLEFIGLHGRKFIVKILITERYGEFIAKMYDRDGYSLEDLIRAGRIPDDVEVLHDRFYKIIIDCFQKYDLKENEGWFLLNLTMYDGLCGLVYDFLLLIKDVAKFDEAKEDLNKELKKHNNDFIEFEGILRPIDTTCFNCGYQNVPEAQFCKRCSGSIDQVFQGRHSDRWW